MSLEPLINQIHHSLGVNLWLPSQYLDLTLDSYMPVTTERKESIIARCNYGIRVPVGYVYD